MSWFLYVIECAGGSLYTGIARDPQARFADHAAGKGAKYTRSHPPVKLLMVEPHPDRSSALKAEYAFKQLPAAEKRRLTELGRVVC
ncbi:MAG: GIY-YIG nuclease family protein [Usitatibacter sp.]